MRDIVFRGKPKNEAEYETLRELSEDDCENGFVYGSLVVSLTNIIFVLWHFKLGVVSVITSQR